MDYRYMLEVSTDSEPPLYSGSRYRHLDAVPACLRACCPLRPGSQLLLREIQFLMPASRFGSWCARHDPTIGLDASEDCNFVEFIIP